MHILVTGGTGMIGRALIRSLVEDAHSVTVLTRNSQTATADSPAVSFLQWDAKTTDGWARGVEEVDAVVHLAGESLASGRWTASQKKRIRDSRVVSGEALVAAIRNAANRPKVLVQSSAVGFYGPGGSQVIDEDSAPGRDFLAHVCFEWEAATAPVEKLGVRRTVARSAGLVLSRDAVALRRLLLPFKFFAGGKMGSGQQWWSWIHIADEVRALRFLIENSDATGAFNLTAPNPVTNQEFATTLGKVMGRPSKLPAPALALSTLLGEMSTVVLNGQRAIPRRLQELGFDFRYPDLDEALKDLVK